MVPIGLIITKTLLLLNFTREYTGSTFSHCFKTSSKSGRGLKVQGRDPTGYGDTPRAPLDQILGS
jgi:hypothetical protein